MSNKKNGTIVITMLSVVLGVVIGIQTKTIQTASAETENSQAIELQRLSEVNAQLANVNAEKEHLETLLEENQKIIKEYENYYSQEDKELEAILSEYELIKMQAGLTELSGRGIEIEINDSNKIGQASQADIDPFLIHAEDILSILNELNTAGAEALSINGQRLVAGSPVRCVGSVIMINEVKVASPFIISAIGSPDVLESALNFPGGVVDSLKPWGIELSITKKENITIPAYTRNIEFIEAENLEEG